MKDKKKKLYRVIEDKQGGEWAMGLDDTALGWLDTASMWAESDENWEVLDHIKHMIKQLKAGEITDKEALDYIDMMWDIAFMESEQAEREGHKLTDEDDETSPTKYFKVEKGVLCGDLYVGEVDSSGEVVGELELEETTADKPQFLRVVEIDEDGTSLGEYKYYYIGKDGTETDIMNRIKATHDPCVWQNNEW